jgi:hypothetical protein
MKFLETRNKIIGIFTWGQWSLKTNLMNIWYYIGKYDECFKVHKQILCIW